MVWVGARRRHGVDLEEEPIMGDKTPKRPPKPKKPKSTDRLSDSPAAPWNADACVVGSACSLTHL